jgi:small-conductance mechanosensitive channel
MGEQSKSSYPKREDLIMQQLFAQITQTVGGYLPSLVAALAILVIGWLVALLVSAGIRRLLNRTTFDNQLAERLGLSRGEKAFPIEETTAKLVFYLIMLFVLVAFFSGPGSDNCHPAVECPSAAGF